MTMNTLSSSSVVNFMNQYSFPKRGSFSNKRVTKTKTKTKNKNKNKKLKKRVKKR
ncbi:hypothetical protein [Methanosarcina barkeri]|uniref:hypothetical protein n=1 Tax=Methanosarcina barkeri TaxID=2208 RepID=UPI0012D48E3B|nr:hypothetical protein [Methanosarcina barkeri]